MVLDGVMIIVAITVLTVLHPGVAFQGHWSAANFTLRKAKGLRHIDAEGGINRGESVEPKRQRFPMKYMPARFSKTKGPNDIVAEKSASQSELEEPKPFRAISYEETR